MRIFGVVLAGGKGRRMGGVDKAFVPLAGRSLIFHVLDRFEPQVERVAISANGDATRFAAFGLRVLPDEEALGPLAGILAAVAWAAEHGADAVVSVAVDGPFLPPDLVPRLCLASDHGEIAFAQSKGKAQPTFALWPVSMLAPLAAFLASGVKPKMMDFMTQVGAVAAAFPDDGAFDNLNTPEDLCAAEALIRGAR